MFIDLSPLKNKDFRNLFLGQLISAFGSQMTAIVIPFQIYALTHSAFYTGLISGVEFIFVFFSSLVGGVFADRFEKRKILIFAELGLIFVPLGLSLNALGDKPNIHIIFALAAIASFLNGLHRPALEAITPRLVPEEDLTKVSALAPTRHILTTILSPMLGGLCIVGLGASVTYLIDSLTFMASLFFLLQIKKVFPKEEKKEKTPSIFKEIIDGYHYIRKRKEIFGSYVTDFIAMVFCNPMALFPALAELFQRQESIGLLYAFPSIGALCMTVSSKWTLKRKRYGVFIVLGGSLWAFSITFVGLAPSFYAVLIGLFCAGFFDMVSGVFRMSLWNQTIPENFRGRLAGFEMLSYTSGPLLGNALLGFLADSFGIQIALFTGGMVSLVLIVLFNYIMPSLWLYQGKDNA